MWVNIRPRKRTGISRNLRVVKDFFTGRKHEPSSHHLFRNAVARDRGMCFGTWHQLRGRRPSQQLSAGFRSGTGGCSQSAAPCKSGDRRSTRHTSAAGAGATHCDHASRRAGGKRDLQSGWMYRNGCADLPGRYRYDLYEQRWQALPPQWRMDAVLLGSFKEKGVAVIAICHNSYSE